MDNKNKKYTWYPENADRFYNTYDSFEECLEAAQLEYKNKEGEFYVDDRYSPLINVGTVEEIDIDEIVNDCFENLEDVIYSAVENFTFTTDCEPEVYHKAGKLKEIKEKLKEIIENYYYIYPTKKCNCFKDKYILHDEEF